MQSQFHLVPFYDTVVKLGLLHTLLLKILSMYLIVMSAIYKSTTGIRYVSIILY